MTQAIGSTDYTESVRRLSVFGWAVAADYVLEDGGVVALSQRRKIHASRALIDPTYFPLTRTELPAEFAKIASGSDDDVLAFVRRYGLLGYSVALTGFEQFTLTVARAGGRKALNALERQPRPDPWLTQVMKPDVLIDLNYDTTLPGDPVAWVLAHAENVKLAGELGRALHEGDVKARADGIQAVLERRIVHTDTVGDVRQRGDFKGLAVSAPVARRGWSRPRVATFPVTSWDEIALELVSFILTRNLGGVRRAIGFSVKTPRLVSLFAPQNLLDCIYWLLADAVTGTQLRACPDCGHFFVATHERMKYCPPPMGIQGPSRCMNRAKVRRWREPETTAKRTRKSRPRRKPR